jgi:hypothetical protein
MVSASADSSGGECDPGARRRGLGELEAGVLALPEPHCSPSELKRLLLRKSSSMEMTCSPLGSWGS